LVSSLFSVEAIRAGLEYPVMDTIVIFSVGWGLEPPCRVVSSALNNGGVLTIFDHFDANLNGGQVHTAGKWDAAPTPGTGTTTFTSSTAVFPNHAMGWTLQPDANIPVFFEIIAIDSWNITVKGDATSYVPSNPSTTPTWYFIIPPVGVNKVTAAIDLSPCAYPSRYLAFHYWYIMPVAGVTVSDSMATELEINPGFYGNQWGNNFQGQYQAWHRFYNPTTGRWTTPDPAATPWTNLVGYVGNNPTGHSDPSGLEQFPESISSRNGVIRARTQSNELDVTGNFLARYTISWGKVEGVGDGVEGYLVQHVSILGTIENCDGTNKQTIDWNYFEAWPTVGGSVIGPNTDTFSQWSAKGCEGTRGTIIWNTSAKHFEGELPGFKAAREAARKEGRDVGGPAWGQGGKPANHPSGTLMAHIEKYARFAHFVWDDWSSGTEALRRQYMIEWDCCCDNEWEVTATLWVLSSGQGPYKKSTTVAAPAVAPAKGE